MTRRAWAQALALEAGRYGRTVTAAAYGGAGDARGADLPSRLAAQQMGVLAGMSIKVPVPVSKLGLNKVSKHNQGAF